MQSPLPPRVERFLGRSITSVEQLEILLLLRNGSGPDTTEGIARALKTSPVSVAVRLKLLCASGLVESVDGAYRYGVQDAAVDRVVGEVANLYPRRKHTVISAIFEDGRSHEG